MTGRSSAQLVLPTGARRRGPKPRPRLTRRHREIAEWISRAPLATAALVARRFSVSLDVSYRCLRVLRAWRLVDYHRLLHEGPGFFVAPGRRIRLATVDHDLMVARVLAELEAGGLSVLSEADLRRSARLEGHARYAVDLSWSGSARRRWHWPDLSLPRAEAPAHPSMALEVEASMKGSSRLRHLLSAYLRSAAYERVLYLATERRVGERVGEIAAELGAGGRVRVRVISSSFDAKELIDEQLQIEI